MPKLNVNRKSALLLVVVGVIAAVLLWPKPVRTWQGKTVQEWAREAARMQRRLDHGNGIDLKDLPAIRRQFEEVEDAILTFGPEAVPALLAMLETQPSVVTAKLCEWGHWFGWDKYFGEPNELERQAGAFGLRLLGSDVRSELPRLAVAFSASCSSGDYVMPLLAGLGKPAMPVFLDALTNATVHPQVRESAFQGLAWLGTNANSASGVLCGFLTNSNPVIRQKALRAFFHTSLPDVRLFAGLGPFLSDADVGVRYTACEGMGWVAKALPPGTPELAAAAAAVAAMRYDRVETPRMFAAMSLGQFGGAAEPQIPALLELLHDPHPAVRGAAVKSLAALKLQLATVVPALIAGLDDPDAYVRETVAVCLRGLGAEAEKVRPGVLAELGSLGKERFEVEQRNEADTRRMLAREQRLRAKQEAKK
jgi:HEAT repeat protein